MEVTTKRLHRHALPVVLVVFGLFGLAVVYGSVTPESGAAIGRALIAKPVHITPTKNGLAEVSLNTKESKTSHVDMSQTGRTAEVSFMVR